MGNNKNRKPRPKREPKSWKKNRKKKNKRNGVTVPVEESNCPVVQLFDPGPLSIDPHTSHFGDDAISNDFLSPVPPERFKIPDATHTSAFKDGTKIVDQPSDMFSPESAASPSDSVGNQSITQLEIVENDDASVADPASLEWHLNSPDESCMDQSPEGEVSDEIENDPVESGPDDWLFSADGDDDKSESDVSESDDTVSFVDNDGQWSIRFDDDVPQYRGIQDGQESSGEAILANLRSIDSNGNETSEGTNVEKEYVVPQSAGEGTNWGIIVMEPGGNEQDSSESVGLEDFTGNKTPEKTANGNKTLSRTMIIGVIGIIIAIVGTVLKSDTTKIVGSIIVITGYILWQVSTYANVNKTFSGILMAILMRVGDIILAIGAIWVILLTILGNTTVMSVGMFLMIVGFVLKLVEPENRST